MLPFSSDIHVWKRINMRNIEHLIGVELIHDLYNQYDFKINSIRFRNTITTWENGIVNSYAPQSEWDTMERHLGEKFYNLDKLLVSELLSLYALQRDFAENYLTGINLDTISELSNIQIKQILIDIQNYTLGDLYRLNFVQVEHALTSAIRKKMDYLSIPQYILPELIVSPRLTAFQEEEIAFSKLFKECVNENQEARIKKISEHWSEYAYMHCAYGEKPYSLNFYIEKFNAFSPSGDIASEVKTASQVSAQKLASYNSPELSEMIQLLILGGDFRDRNKARLGQTMRFKFAILDEIARRSKIARESISYYSMQDLCNLLDYSVKLPSEILSERKNGVVLVRNEVIGHSVIEIQNIVCKNFRFYDKDITKAIEEPQASLEGFGASKGVVTGTVKIILSADDTDKIQKGDIMVAVGTDFNLMDAIYKSSGVITEEGGLLSHASVVCRELKKPCCIGVLDVTTKLYDGLKVEIDGSKGLVTILKNG